MVTLLAGLLLTATPTPSLERLFAELDVGLPGKAATAVAISPRNDRVILAAVEGILFRSDDGGTTFDAVLKPAEKRNLSAEEQMRMEDQAEEAAEDEAASGDINPDDFNPDLDPADMENALEDLEDDLQQSLEADSQSGDGSLPEGDLTVGTDDGLPLVQELPGVRRILFVGDTVYVATKRGLYRSVDQGETFEQVDLPRTGGVRDVRDVAVAPNVPTLLVAVTGGGALISRDGGVSWLPASGVAGRAPGLTAALGPGDKPVVALGTRFGLLRSVDGGLNFEPMLLPGEKAANRAVVSVAVDASQDRLYALTQTMLFAGAVRGRVLSPVGASWRTSMLTVHTQAEQPGVLWAGGRNGVFVSRDGGRTAVEIGGESMVRDVVGVAVGRQDHGLVVLATATGVLAYLPVHQIPGGLKPIQLFRILVAQEPTEGEAAEWAVQHHRADPAVTQSMRTRARLAGLAPEVRLTAAPPYGLQYGFFSVGAGSGIPVTQYSLQNRVDVAALATWNLDRVFTRTEESAVAREHRRLLKERDRIWRKVLKTYEERRRLQADIIARPSRSALALARKRLRLEGLTAVLDALTGGRFTLEAARRGAPGDGFSVRIPAAGRPG